MSGREEKKFDTQEEVKKVIIAVGFMLAVPAGLLLATGVDVFQGCVTFTEDDVKRYPGNTYPTIDDDGERTTMTAVPGQCKPLKTSSGFVNEVLQDVQTYIPLAILLFMLAMGLAIFFGPGIKIIKNQYGK